MCTRIVESKIIQEEKIEIIPTTMAMHSQQPSQDTETSSDTREERDTSDDENSREGNRSENDEERSRAELLAAVLDRLALYQKAPRTTEPQKRHGNLDDVIQRILDGEIKNIICMCGAGISVGAGIPDFRSPGTGLYSKLEKYNLSHPEAIFEIDYFRSNPHPFYLLSKELYPGLYSPTKAHYFMKLLHDKGLLRRCYTQNIDSLEHAAGLPKDAIIAAHGNFDTSYCIDCKADHDVEYVRDAIMKQSPCRCAKTNGCQGLVKPGIVFFGENLPERYWKSIPKDFDAADLLIVMGSSLVVQPFASLIDRPPKEAPRILINREIVGETHPEMKQLGCTKGFDFSGYGERNDIALLGDCDDMIVDLCSKLGWNDDLENLVQSDDLKKK